MSFAVARPNAHRMIATQRCAKNQGIGAVIRRHQLEVMAPHLSPLRSDAHGQQRADTYPHQTTGISSDTDSGCFKPRQAARTSAGITRRTRTAAAHVMCSRPLNVD